MDFDELHTIVHLHLKVKWVSLCAASQNRLDDFSDTCEQ